MGEFAPRRATLKDSVSKFRDLHHQRRKERLFIVAKEEMVIQRAMARNFETLLTSWTQRPPLVSSLVTFETGFSTATDGSGPKSEKSLSSLASMNRTRETADCWHPGGC